MLWNFDMNNDNALQPVQQHTGELASSSTAAQARALVEAKYVIAIQRPRDLMKVRADILAACRRPGFAAAAWYSKPAGGNKTVTGPSIRFAETAILSMTNITVIPSIRFQDDKCFILYIEVLDLESNTSYGDEVVIQKTVERKNSNDREVVGERINSRGEKVFVVKATDDEIAQKMASAKSKVIRNNGLRLVPKDFIEDAEEVVRETLEKGGGESLEVRIKKMVDAFIPLGVKPDMLSQYLGHKVESCSPQELTNLRLMFTAIKEGEATWQSYVQNADDSVQKAPTTAPSFGKKGGKTVDAETTKPHPAIAVIEARLEKDSVTFPQIRQGLLDANIIDNVYDSLSQCSGDELTAILSVLETAISNAKEEM